VVQVAKNSKKTTHSKGKYRSAVTGRYVKEAASPEAKEFSRWFNERYRETLRDLSKR
jgi:hypothetical protein